MIHEPTGVLFVLLLLLLSLFCSDFKWSDCVQRHVLRSSGCLSRIWKRVRISPPKIYSQARAEDVRSILYHSELLPLGAPQLHEKHARTEKGKHACKTRMHNTSSRVTRRVRSLDICPPPLPSVDSRKVNKKCFFCRRQRRDKKDLTVWATQEICEQTL